MKQILLEIAAALLAYAGFALFQAVADGQPLGAAASRRRGVRATARSLAVGTVIGGAMLLSPAIGGGAAWLFVALAVSSAATVFVLLAPVRPTLAWGAAVIAPPLSLALLVASREMP